MTDLVCLVADKNIEATIQGVLRRPQALGVRELSFETIVHPRRDSGCFHQAEELLGGYRGRAAHALVVFDRAWDGAPAATGAEIEALFERDRDRDLDWLRAVVIDPELEVWVFGDSPHVASCLGWPGSTLDLRAALEAQGLWRPESAKPPHPKQAVEWLLFRVRKPRSSSLYRDLADHVSLSRCSDRSFLRLKAILREWFAPQGGQVEP